MDVCSYAHEEICHEGGRCPVCELVEEHEQTVSELENEMVSLKNEMKDLENEMKEER